MAEAARKLIQNNGLSDIITVIQGKIEEVCYLQLLWRDVEKNVIETLCCMKIQFDRLLY